MTTRPQDDNLRTCTICGLTVDISKGSVAPAEDFSQRGRFKKLEAALQLQTLTEKLATAERELKELKDCAFNALLPGPRTEVKLADLDKANAYIRKLEGAIKSFVTAINQRDEAGSDAAFAEMRRLEKEITP